MIRIYIFVYLIAIIAANLSVVQFGPRAAVINAFLFIGLDITTRDYLHEAWHGHRLWGKMLLLITSGSVLSYTLNRSAGPIALASFVAFAAAGSVDTAIYAALGERTKMWRVNGSNIGAAAVDSLVFPAIAFGFPILWWVMLGQFAAKVAGGFVWSLVGSALFENGELQ
jgi:uncharacterized PurR-regulated membrane protein YhhQ (DUF165 family)